MKVGDEVVCIKSHSQGLVIKGKNYIIAGFEKCKCVTMIVIEGVYIPGYDGQLMYSCSECGVVTNEHSGLNGIDIKLFAQIQKNKSFRSNSLSKRLAKEAQESTKLIEVEELEISI